MGNAVMNKNIFFGQHFDKYFCQTGGIFFNEIFFSIFFVLKFSIKFKKIFKYFIFPQKFHHIWPIFFEDDELKGVIQGLLKSHCDSSFNNRIAPFCFIKQPAIRFQLTVVSNDHLMWEKKMKTQSNAKSSHKKHSCVIYFSWKSCYAKKKARKRLGVDNIHEMSLKPHRVFA